MTTLRDIADRLLPDALSAFGLLSRLPLPDHRGSGSASAWAWPLVGAVIGGLAALVGSLALWLGLTPGVAAVLVLAFGAMLTGGLHEDGLSDTADGLFGGWTRERRLEIMKDSRVGSYGVLALVLVTLARWAALEAIVAGGSLWALVAVGALSRAPMAVLMAALPSARGSGLSHATGRPPPAVAAVGVILALGIALVFAGGAVTWMTLAVLLVCGWLAHTAKARIGGQTGDILGAGQQLAEAACLAVLAARV